MTRRSSRPATGLFAALLVTTVLSVACAPRSPAPGPRLDHEAEDHAAYYLSRPHRGFDCRECHERGWTLAGVRCLPCHQDETVLHHRDNPPCARCHTTDHWENLLR
ncbi:MAG: hypothetical protein GW783_00645 [Deltaproteobacteria bacterium]|nr:hypothetical protein [Deltaproteobacteria bacterium]NCP95554.1 hypothetical protein [Deltaproteobacteria bacterium]NCS72625.1 hypothetical protein [Deltaproteobacteria bacterium]